MTKRNTTEVQTVTQAVKAAKAPVWKETNVTDEPLDKYLLQTLPDEQPWAR